ncbi:hypothetical protein BJX62DRAFT_232535 [Aspergillus germanicus]
MDPVFESDTSRSRRLIYLQIFCVATQVIILYALDNAGLGVHIRHLTQDTVSHYQKSLSQILSRIFSAADHETGGLTLNGYDPLPLRDAAPSGEYLQALWDSESPEDAAAQREFLLSEILPLAALTDASEDEITGILGASSIGSGIVSLLSSRAGVDWSTSGHTSVDVTLHGYAAGKKRRALQADLAGGGDSAVY